MFQCKLFSLVLYVQYVLLGGHFCVSGVLYILITIFFFSFLLTSCLSPLLSSVFACYADMWDARTKFSDICNQE